MDSMSVTFVTAFLDLHDESNSYRPPEKRIQFFNQLNATGIRLHVFVSPENLENIKVTNGIIETLQLEDLHTYSISPNGMPDTLTQGKDTRNFLILMNSKIELVNRAIESGKHSTNHYAWIDFNIFHILSDSSSEQLKRLSTLAYPESCMYFPGCWDKQIRFDTVNWRFCGGFFLGDTLSLREMYQLQCTVYPKLPKLTWEVNTWACLESLGWSCTWYPGDHNDSILNIPL
jgi:hypothetical protein